MLKAIHVQESLETATEKADRIVQELRRMKLAMAAELAEASIHETRAYYRYPQTHWIRLRTINPLERIMREIRRRTRVVGAFPDGNSALMLVAARLRHIAGTKWGTHRYLSIEALEKQSLEQLHSA